MESGIWCHISNEAKELVKRMLHVDPNRRPTAAFILKYPWIINRHRIPQKVLPDVIKDPHSLKVCRNINISITSIKHFDFVNSPQTIKCLIINNKFIAVYMCCTIST